MESAEHEGREPSQRPARLLVRESHAVERQLSGGVTKPLRRSFIHFSIDGKVSQKHHVEGPLRPRYAKHGGSKSAQGSSKRAKDMAC
jgi:hypothetical protein